jgi:Flp pilus assembly protein TadD
MILLASQTGDAKPLIHAVDALQAVDELYSSETTPKEKAEVRQTLADTLLTLGRANEDVAALEHAVTAYRDAITLASLLGDQKLRRALKRNYGKARELLGDQGSSASLKGAA